MWVNVLETDNLAERQDYYHEGRSSSSSSHDGPTSPIPLNIMAGYESNGGAKAMRDRRAGKAAKPPSTPMAESDDDD